MYFPLFWGQKRYDRTCENNQNFHIDFSTNADLSYFIFVLFWYILGSHPKIGWWQFIVSVGSDICYLLVYVDDILLTGNNVILLQRLIQLLSLEFKLRDLGAIHYFLGIEVQCTGLGLIIECNYIGNIVVIFLCGNLHHYYCILPYSYI